MTQAVAVMTEFKRLAALVPDWNWATAAVIAREWKFLQPVRSYCEVNGISVQMADEDTAYFWRVRETQALVEWLRAREIKLVDTAVIGGWLDQQPTGPWWTLLREALDEYTLESNGAELPVDHFMEWLAEWGRELRRRQTGLMLLTAHRAKGLEFDHVAVLDSDWEKVRRNEDPDAPRRLYYVAMTRARKTLTLAHFDQAHVLLDALPEDGSLLRRVRIALPKPVLELARCYERPPLKDIDLGFAGSYAANHSIHRAIAMLTAGDSVHLRQRNERWDLIDDKGNTVGSFARAFKLRVDMTCVAARVIAIIVRRRADTEPEYLDRVRCERWEVVVPELVFAPVCKAPFPLGGDGWGEGDRS
jgi:ATP-dependent DNA helicase RecQ